MPRTSSPPSPPSPPPVQTASTTRPALIPSYLPRAADGGITDPELERRWASVKARLSAVLEEVRRTKQPVKTDPRDWVTMYSDVAKLYSKDDALRKRRMYVYVRQFVRDLVATQLAHLNTLDGQELLKEYCRTWDASLTFVGFMKRVLHHLHKFWIKYNANTLKDDPVRPLDKLLMFYWREDLLSNLHSVVDIALEMVDMDRRGEHIDHDVVRGVVDTLVEVGGADIASPDSDSAEEDETSANLSKLHLYIRVFEDDFLALTRAFYKTEGEKLVAMDDVTRFMKSVLARLEEEDHRGNRLLHPDSSKRLRQATEEQLIGNHKEYLQNAAKEMVRAGREDDLKLLYTLLSKVENGLTPLRSFFVGFVRREGNAVVLKHADEMNGKDDVESNLGLIRSLVRLYRKHASLIRRCFNGSQIIMLGVDDAFRGFANRPIGSLSLANLMAHYVDHLLRKGRTFDREMWDIPDSNQAVGTSSNMGGAERSESAGADASPAPDDSPPKERPRKRQRTDSGMKEPNGNEVKKDTEEEALSRYMSELVRLFMFLDDKDLFSETHRGLFATRLLATYDEELEERFIEKLKVEMGPTYTQRLSGMLKDKLVSNSLRCDFAKYIEKKREEREVYIRKKNEVEALKQTDAIVGLTMLRHDKTGGIDLYMGNVSSSDEVEKEKGNEKSGEKAETNGTEGDVNTSNTSVEAKGSGEGGGEKEGQNGDKKVSKIDISDDYIGEALKIDFNSHVLNALHWPAVKSGDVRMAPALAACQALFSDFYMTDKETRKLSWIHTLSTVQLGASFGANKYSLVVSAVQGCLLLLFNKRDEIRVGDAAAELNISKKELLEHIKPLLVGKKSRMLIMEKRGTKKGNENEEETGKDEISPRAVSGQAEEEDEEDVLRVKTNFKSKVYRIVVAGNMMKRANTETGTNKRKVVVDRSTQIDAALVRMLKARKEMYYADLTAQVVESLSGMFLPDPRMIKARLERLIDQEYVERDGQDARLYRYSA